MIYFTMNTLGPTRAVTPRPTESPTAAGVETEAPVTSAPMTGAPVTAEPTQSPDAAFAFGSTLVDGEAGEETGDAKESTSTTAAPVETFTLAPIPNPAPSPLSDNQAPTKSPEKAPTPFTFTFSNPSGNQPGRKLGESRKPKPDLRNLQLASGTNTGKLVILSHSRSGEPIYEFDSRSLSNVQRHAFAAAGIARSPRYGNYVGGEGNRQDVVMWASKGGTDVRRGETFLFQLPKDFDPTVAGDAITDDFEVRVLESVGWTTDTPPTFSSDGLAVYFARSGNRYVGWNEGREFDVISNFGGELPPTDTSAAIRPVVLTDGDEKMIIEAADHDRIFAVDTTGPDATGIYWLVDGLGVQSIPTTPIVSPDGEVIYFGKGSAIYGINATDGARLWGQDGYVQDTAVPFAIRAEMSLSSTGEFLYHQGEGMSITALRVAEAIPTPAPTGGPSFRPSIASSVMPSGAPSVVASELPSTTTAPTESAVPTESFSPSHDPEYIFPSMIPSLAPSVVASSGPSRSFAPSDSPTGVAPDGTVAGPGLPTVSPVMPPTLIPVTPSVVLPPSTIPGDDPTQAVTSPDESSESSSLPSWLTNTAIIGISVGGGVALILMVGAIWYVARRKGGGDDGLDTDWQAQNSQHGGGGPGGGDDGGAMFEYGEEDDFAGQGDGGGRGPSSSGYGAPMGSAPGSSGTWGAAGGQQGEGGPVWGEPGRLRW